MALLPPDPVYTFNQRGIGPINSLCFHQNERLYAATQTGQVHLFDLQTNRSTYKIHLGENSVISISHTEESLISMEKGGILKNNKLTNSGYCKIEEIDLEHTGFCKFDYCQQDEILIAPKNERNISIRKLNSLKEISTLSENSTDILSCVKYLNFHGNSYILAGYETGKLKLWDLRTNNVLACENFGVPLTSLDFDLISQRGIIGTISDCIRLFSMDMKSNKILKKADLQIKNSGVNCVKIRKDLKVFSAGCFHGSIRIYSWKSLRPLAVLSEHKEDVMDIAFSNEPVSFWKSNIMAACSTDGKISLWDLYN